MDSSKEYGWEFDKVRDLYIRHGAMSIFVHKDLYNEWLNSGKNIVRKIKKPFKIICRGRSRLADRWKKIISQISVAHEFLIIENAGHGFDEEGTEDKLFQETLDYLQNN